MNCPNCGRELAEGEVCNCTQENEQAQEFNASPSQPEQNYYDPSVQQGYYNPNVQQGVYNQQQYQTQGTYYDPNAAYYNPPAPEKGPARTDYPKGYKIKKKYAAVILAATLGVFGIHNFYLGNTGKAIAQVLIATVGSLFLGIGFVAAYVWATVEAVLLLIESIDRDADGYKIQTFEEALAKEMNK